MKLQTDFSVTAPCTLIEALHAHTSLSKSALKRALTHGGIWLQPQAKGKKQRCRRATKPLKTNDRISIYYDDRLYYSDVPSARNVLDGQGWGIWYKPPNVVSQGTPYGDRGCMEEQVRSLSGQKHVHLVHRLDREASGLLLIAYSPSLAAKLSQIWLTPTTQKHYCAWVTGNPPASGEIAIPLDGKTARTCYQTRERADGMSRLDIQIDTGRFHQIRRHFAAIGHPLAGDPKYGENNKHKAGLQLSAVRIVFTCPTTNRTIDCRLPDDMCPLIRHPSRKQ